MSKRRSMILMHPPGDGGMKPLGKAAELEQTLAPYNIAPDGSAPRSGTAFLYGPGLVVQVPTSTPEITQAMVSIKDQDIAWAVLSRVCKGTGWVMVDPESGQTFGSHAAEAR